MEVRLARVFVCLSGWAFVPCCFILAAYLYNVSMFSCTFNCLPALSALSTQIITDLKCLINLPLYNLSERSEMWNICTVYCLYHSRSQSFCLSMQLQRSLHRLGWALSQSKPYLNSMNVNWDNTKCQVTQIKMLRMHCKILSDIRNWFQIVIYSTIFSIFSSLFPCLCNLCRFCFGYLHIP